MYFFHKKLWVMKLIMCMMAFFTLNGHAVCVASIENKSDAPWRFLFSSNVTLADQTSCYTAFCTIAPHSIVKVSYKDIHARGTVSIFHEDSVMPLLPDQQYDYGGPLGGGFYDRDNCPYISHSTNESSISLNDPGYASFIIWKNS